MVLVLLVILGLLAWAILGELERIQEPLPPPSGDCPGCGRPVEDDWLLCPLCHERLRESCGQCGQANPVYHRFCSACGEERGGGQ